jgi:hypothetical protein
MVKMFGMIYSLNKEIGLELSYRAEIFKILSHVWGSMTNNNNRFWIG